MLVRGLDEYIGVLRASDIGTRNVARGALPEARFPVNHGPAFRAVNRFPAQLKDSALSLDLVHWSSIGPDRHAVLPSAATVVFIDCPAFTAI
jgi:hypothetical protein